MWLVVTILICLAYVGVSFVLAVCVHEAGHILGGLAGGYSFSSVSILGAALVRQEGKLRLKWIRHAPFGQVIMSPKRQKTRPSLLIMGGICLNAAVSAVLAAGLILSSNIYVVYALSVFFVWNFVNVLSNFFGKGDTDGKAFFAVRGSAAEAAAYDRLMAVCAALNDGIMPCEMDAGIFGAPMGGAGACICGELELYRYLHHKKHLCDSDALGAVERGMRQYPGYAERWYVEKVILSLGNGTFVLGDDAEDSLMELAMSHPDDARSQLLCHLIMIRKGREDSREALRGYGVSRRRSLFDGIWKEGLSVLGQRR